MRKFLPVAEFAPDRSPFISSYTDNLLNVLPTADGVKPMPQMQEVSVAFGEEVRNIFFTRNANEQFALWLAGGTLVKKVDTSGSPYGFTDFTRLAGNYNLPASDRWSYTQFNDFLILAQLGDPLQYLDLTSGANFADISGAPTAKYVKTVGPFLVALYTDTSQTGPFTIQWSGIHDYSWWTAGERYSDSQVLDGGFEIVGAVHNLAGGLDIFMRDGAWRMSLTPNSFGAFEFNQIQGARGCAAPHSIVEVGDGRTFFLSDSGFYSWPDGMAIGAERVDQFFFDTINNSTLSDVQGSLDPFEKTARWKFETADGTTRILIYDYQLNKWSYGNQNLQASGKMAAPGLTWDGLDQFYASIDDAVAPFDSKLFKGGAPVFAGATTNQKLAFASGTPEAATIETAEESINPPHRAFVNAGYLVGDVDTFTAQVGSKELYGGTISYDSAVSPSSRTGKLPFRSGGRLHQAKINIAAGEDWNHINGMWLEYEGDGE